MQEEDFGDVLLRLKPAATTADLLKIAMEVGRRSARREAHRWRAVTATSAIVALAAVFVPHSRVTDLRTTTVDVEPAASLASAPSSVDLRRVAASPENVVLLRDAVLAGGLAALPNQSFVRAEKSSVRKAIRTRGEL